MSQKLFHQDPYLREFSGRVVRSLQHDGKPAVVLDHTAFYPTSGGQPHDVGTLGSAHVVDVVEQGEDVVHVLDVAVSGDVKGSINWDRRRDNMQHHHGQHLLSAAFEKLFDADTTSCHLGDGVCSVDLNRAVSMTDAEAAEELTSRVIWENRVVGIKWHTKDEVAKLPLRRPPQVEGPIRIVTVEGFDANPCCGTHPKSTGEVGVVTVLGVEKRGKESRVSFLCGYRAVANARRNAAVLRGVGTKLSAGRDDLEVAIERIKSESADARKALKAAEKRLAAIDAAELAASGQKLIVKVFEGKDLDYLRAVATEIAAKPGRVVALGGSGPISSILLARAKDIELDLRPIGKEALAKVNGKGGGPPNLVQGGGEGADIKGALEIAERMIRAAMK